AALAGVVIFDQLVRRGAAGAGDREQVVEKMCLVLAGEAAAGSSMQPLAGDFQHFKRDVTQSSAAMRGFEAEAWHVATHRLSFVPCPVGDPIAGGGERGALVEHSDP